MVWTWFWLVMITSWVSCHLLVGRNPATRAEVEDTREVTLTSHAQDALEKASSCSHARAVPVDLLTADADGKHERVAWWCASCETQLPAEFKLPMVAHVPFDPDDPWSRVVVRAFVESRSLSW